MSLSGRHVAAVAPPDPLRKLMSSVLDDTWQCEHKPRWRPFGKPARQTEDLNLPGNGLHFQAEAALFPERVVFEGRRLPPFPATKLWL